jgi:KDO2-lipid IV(A) lauroyltransferase
LRRPTRFPFFHGAAGYAFGAFVGRISSRRLCQGFGRLITSFYAWLQPSRLPIIQKNLALLTGREATPAEARAVFREFGHALADYFYLARRPASCALDLISEHVGFEHFEAVRQQGRGGLLLTPHLGFFELGGAAAHANGFPIIALTHPESSPALTEWRAAYRARWGVETFEVEAEDQFVFIDIVRKLDAGRLVAALMDRAGSSKTSRVRLPGGVVEFSGGILLLAMARGCPVIPVTTVRLPNGTYRVEAHEPFMVERDSRDTAAILERYCQRLADVFLPVLQKYPSQWFHFVPLTER